MIERYVLLILFSIPFIFAAVLGIHLHGFAKGYREGLDDGIKACGGVKNGKVD